MKLNVYVCTHFIAIPKSYQSAYMLSVPVVNWGAFIVHASQKKDNKKMILSWMWGGNWHRKKFITKWFLLIRHNHNNMLTFTISSSVTTFDEMMNVCRWVFMCNPSYSHKESYSCIDEVTNSFNLWFPIYRSVYLDSSVYWES